MSVLRARKQAEKLVEDLSSAELPVDLHRIAKRLGLRIIHGDLGVGISGLLVSRAGATSICVQEKDPPRRRRFTVAHEIGHFCLGHQHEPGGHIIVDRGHLISQRAALASEGVDSKEIEANQFAACLLMPSWLVRAELTKLGGPPALDDRVEALANKFNVSELAMTFRLTTLRLL